MTENYTEAVKLLISGRVIIDHHISLDAEDIYFLPFNSTSNISTGYT